MRKLKTYDNGGPKVKQRRGVRKNYGEQTWTPSGLQFPTSVSSHLMTTEYIPGRGWVSFPSLFQDSKPYADDQQNWVDMSGEEDWMKIYEEADRRGEVYDFGEDEEAALAFGEGSWKDQLPDEGLEIELTDEEVEQYKAGGYILEELEDGGNVSWNFKGKSYSGTLIPGMEDANNRYARTHNGKIKTLPKRPHGGSHEGDPPNNLTYDQRKQAYDDSLTLYNYSRNLLDLHKQFEAFPTYGEVYGPNLDGDLVEDGYYDRYLAKTAPVKMAVFNDFVDDHFTGDTPEVNAFVRLATLNEGEPGYYGNTLDIPSGYDQYLHRRFTTFDKPKVPIRKPTMKEAYKNVDKEKYPTFEDFEYAAEFYKEHGKNPDPSDLPSNRLPAPPPPNYEIEDIEPEVEIEKLDVIKPELISNDTELPDIIERDEVEGVDYKIKRGPYIQPGLDGNPFGRFGHTYWRGPRLKFGERRVPIEDELTYPEGFVPGFKHGGPHEISLSTGKLRPQTTSTGTTLGYRQVFPKKDTTWSLTGNLGYGKNLDTDEEGLAASINAENFGKFFNGQRRLNAVTNLEAFVEPGNYGAQISSGPNLHWGSHPKRDLNRGTGRVDFQPFNLRLGYQSTPWTDDSGDVLFRGTSGRLGWGYGAKLKGEYALPRKGALRRSRINPVIFGDAGVDLDFLLSDMNQEGIDQGSISGRHEGFRVNPSFSANVGLRIPLDGMNIRRRPNYNPGIRTSEGDYKDGGSTGKKKKDMKLYFDGGPLTDWANDQALAWEGLDEFSSQGRDLASSYFAKIGDSYNLGKLNKGKSVPHWSAATVSSGVMAGLGANNKEEAQALGFNPTASHSGYVRDAFKTLKNPNYKYNKYVPTKMSDAEFEVGDILVKGRRTKKGVGTSKWSYEDFASHDNDYPSHGDIIVDKGTDDKGDYVILAGGNLSDTYKNQKVYVKSLSSKYKVNLKDTQRSASSMERSGAPSKVTNIGEDVTINKKKKSPFANNFDLDYDNDQEVIEDTTPAFPELTQFSSNIIPSGTQALFGDDTLGIGYIPYQYQFPDYLGEQPQQEQYIDDSYVKFGTEEEESNVEPETDDTDETVDPEENIDESTDESIDDEVYDATEDEEVDEELSEDEKLQTYVQDAEFKKQQDILIKADKEFKKKTDEGLIWISYNDPSPPMVTEGWKKAQKSIYNKPPNIYGTVASLVDEGGEDYLEFGEFYGDGSKQYGEWVSEDAVNAADTSGGSWEQWYNSELNSLSPTMQNSGRAAGFYPDLNFLFGPVWGPLSFAQDLRDNSNLGNYEDYTPPSKKGFVESLPDIGNNISNWPVVKNLKYWWDNWEEGGSIPKANNGGYIIDLDEDEALAYAKKGYIVEEIK